jgi:hypothetical protein
MILKTSATSSSLPRELSKIPDDLNSLTSSELSMSEFMKYAKEDIA